MQTIFDVAAQRAKAQEQGEDRRVGFTLPYRYARFVSYLDVAQRNNLLLDLLQKHLEASGMDLNANGVPVSKDQIELFEGKMVPLITDDGFEKALESVENLLGAKARVKS